MKILWVKSDFLHPTTRGGQIRTLEMLKVLHRRHEVHYLGLTDEPDGEGPRRAGEYSTRSYAVPHRARDKRSLGFVWELLRGLVSPLPVAVARWESEGLRRELKRLLAVEAFDAVVCDFLFPAPHFEDLSKVTLFQHNVEAQIWKRHAEYGTTTAHRAYFGLQARRMEAYEGQVCRAVRRVIGVSEADVALMRSEYGVQRVSPVATGVNLEYFAPAPVIVPGEELVFVGSMDWLPNEDGMKWFAAEVWPLIRRVRPECRLAIVGRKPGPEIQKLGEAGWGVRVTGTVPDVRPWLHGGKVCVVPLRIGGGTRLKIYESMAARLPVVSTTVGAEGLDYQDGENLRVADSAAEFAAACLDLLTDEPRRLAMAEAGWRLVSERYSWEAVTGEFERLLVS
jgi:glycosyltransferase involved in cell wall biosynthesis